MQINKIQIKNYRTLEDLEISFSGFFSSISGKNNAGKTSVVKAIRSIFKDRDREFSFFDEEEDTSYSASVTQWANENSPIEFKYYLSVSRQTDPGLHSFVKKIAELDSLDDSFNLVVDIIIKPKEERDISITIDSNTLGKYETGEIFRRLSSSNIIILHNSTGNHSRMFSPRGFLSFHEMVLSKNEREELKKEQDRIRKKIRKFAQDHRTELSHLLGKLEEKYEVELTMFEGVFRDTIPLGINLKDKGVEVPLDDWGSGTQNRTRIMMSILSASRVKQQVNDENRITPIIIIEEPESFLHPSAQAEFGRVIRALARELGIQIIITTHSPYMLCQEQPEANILLDRKIFRGKLKSTELISISEESWMEPFGKILGLDDEAVAPWSDVVKASKDNAILVEGAIDKEYLEYISSLKIKGYELPEHIEVIPYGGKDALKNSIMLKFVIEKFDKVFITFDLDAKKEITKSISQIGLEEERDYISLGIDEDGKDCGHDLDELKSELR